jgi:hypothetical protein
MKTVFIKTKRYVFRHLVFLKSRNRPTTTIEFCKVKKINNPANLKVTDRLILFASEDYRVNPTFFVQKRNLSSFINSFIAGANPTIAIYNASVVNFYNATGSLARFENKNILFSFEKHSSLLQRWRCSCKLKNRRIGPRCRRAIQIFKRFSLSQKLRWSVLHKFSNNF